MNNSQTVRYALMCLQAWDIQEGKPLSAKDISRQQGVPMDQCLNVLVRLERAGVLSAPQTGRYVLVRPLGEFSALEIVEALAPAPKAPPAFASLYAATRGATRQTHLAARLGTWIGVGAALLGLALLAKPANAGYDVGTKFADVIMENVTPGKVYNLRTMRNLPYRILNKSDGEIELSVGIDIPVKDQLKPGYEAIPDPSWVRLVPDHFKLQKGEEGIVDVILQVPSDSPIGKHYQAHLVCKSADPEPGDQVGLAFGLALQSRLRFSVASPGPEEIRRLQKKGLYQMLNFTLEPDSQYLPGFIEPGKKAALGDSGQTLTLINRSPQKITYTLKAVKAPEGMSPPTGYEHGEPQWVKVKTPVLKMEGVSIKASDVEITIPNKPEYRGRRFMFVIQAGLEGRDIPVEVYGRLYTNVAK